MDSIRRLDGREIRDTLERANVLGLSDGARRRLGWFLFTVENKASIEETSDHFGIAPTTFRRWLQRFDSTKPSSLEERSRRPHRVRRSDVEGRVITLIETYRRRYPTMGPRNIRKKLQAEHNIIISTSTIWRVIDLNLLFFADTISHRLRRDGGKEIGWTGGVAAGIVFAIALFSGFSAPRAEAAESTSFQLSAEYPTHAEHEARASDNFQLEGGVTWKRQPAASSNFQIVFAPAQEAAAAPSEAVVAEEGAAAQRGIRDETRERRIAAAIGEGEPPVKPAAAPEEERAPVSEELIPTPPSRLIHEIKERAEVVPPGQTPFGISIKAPPDAEYRSDKLRRIFETAIDVPRPEAPRPAVPAPTRAREVMSMAAASFIFPGLLLVFFGLLLFHRTLTRWTRVLLWFAFTTLLIGLVFLWLVPHASAADTMTARHVYNGHLLDSGGNAITSAHTLRFSYWTGSDYASTDVTSTGAINTGASMYGSWQETHTVTPNSSGYFSVELGSGTALPSLSSLPSTFYLQVEVKAASAADTSYELLDTDTSNAAVDRSTVLPVPFALNAETVDHRDIGTASGSIPVLQTGAVFDMAHIPGGTQSGVFVIDGDSSESGDITLQFGGSLAKQLSYSQGNTWFNFNDSVRIQGNLTITGLVNGIDIDTLASGTGSLKVASGGGLTVSVNEGSYRITGTVTNFAGSGSVALTANTTNYVFFTSTGLLVNTIGFPTNHSVIPLAEITTSTDSVTGVTDRRVLVSDDRERTLERVYHPGFEHAAYQGDATNNVGQLTVDHDAINDRNFYQWTSTVSSLQDYDIILRLTLATDFTHWNTGSGNAIRLTYRTTSSDSADNQLDISVFDTNGSPVTLSGLTTDLANTSWTETQIGFTGSPTWTPGGDFIIQFKMHSRDNAQMHLGTVKLRTVELPVE